MGPVRSRWPMNERWTGKSSTCAPVGGVSLLAVEDVKNQRQLLW